VELCQTCAEARGSEVRSHPMQCCPMLRHGVLCYAILCYAVLAGYNVLCCIRFILFYPILYYSVWYSCLLSCSIVSCFVLYCLVILLCTLSRAIYSDLAVAVMLLLCVVMEITMMTLLKYCCGFRTIVASALCHLTANESVQLFP
jgi:hypothetical protein